MRRFFHAEASAALLWIAASLVLAAVLTPWLYQAGNHLAQAAAAEDLPSVWEWLGAAAGRSKFSRFFSRSLIVSAAVLLPLLYWRIRVLKHFPAPAASALQRLPLRAVLLQVLLGFLLTAASLGSLVLILQAIGASTFEANPPPVRKLLSYALLPATVTPLIEEWIFRGLLLGILLKSMRPTFACIGCASLFAFLHFLEPPTGMMVENPAASGAGFELLGKILFHFAELRFFITDFATLWVIGMILSWARLRTGNLAFSIGLHAGWIFTFKASNLYFNSVCSHPLMPWGIGDSMRSGLLPLLMLGITALICRWLLPFLAPNRASR